MCTTRSAGWPRYRCVRYSSSAAESVRSLAYFADQVYYCLVMDGEVSMPTLFGFDVVDANQPALEAA